jgi:hypothetical protein
LSVSLGDKQGRAEEEAPVQEGQRPAKEDKAPTVERVWEQNLRVDEPPPGPISTGGGFAAFVAVPLASAEPLLGPLSSNPGLSVVVMLGEG